MELQLLLVALTVLCTGWVIAVYGTRIVRAPVIPPLAPAQNAALLLWAALLISATHGGAYLVRMVLDRTGALPPHRAGQDGRSETPDGPDEKECQNGRLIGMFERTLLFTAIVVGSYEAFGFLVAAKGLLRIGDLKDKRFAEYVLIGTLTSVTIALVLGLVGQVAVQMGS